MLRIGIATLAVALAGGCGVVGSDPASPHVDGGPTGDAGGHPDDGGPQPTAGLRLTFVSRPELPTSAGGSDDAVIESVAMELDNLRAVGDAATGDSTTAPVVQLAFPNADPDGAPGDPTVVFFGSAPPGYYSHVLASVASYKIDGTARVDGNTVPIEIVDEPAPMLAVEIDVGSVELEINQIAEIDFGIDLRNAVSQVDWDASDDDDGTRTIDSQSTMIGAVRDQVVTSISLIGTSRTEIGQ